MNKDYLKPNAEYVSLIAQEPVTTEDNDDMLDGDMTLESSEF